MIFSELYSAYYNAVAGILKEACAHPLSKTELRKIVEREAFGEICYAKVIDENAVGQIRAMCDSELTRGSRVRIMPDVHAGTGCTIGTTMTVEDRVCPNIVGVDIGCGMYTVRLTDRKPDFRLIDEAVHTIPSGMAVRDEKYEEFDLKGLRCFGRLKDIQRLECSLGTLGGGNHFIEIDRNSEGEYCLIIHSGSRNLGRQVAGYYQQLAVDHFTGRDRIPAEREKLIRTYKEQGRETEIEEALKQLSHQYDETPLPVPESLCWLEGTPVQDYLHDEEICQRFARRSREIMAEIILRETGMTASESFHTIHNYIDTGEMILRKGAIAAHRDEKILIPINMRDGSVIAVGKGNPEWNYSAPHGAGRIMSRSMAKTAISLEEYRKAMKGIYSTSVNEHTLDEAPMAYKSLEDIIGVIGESVDIIDIMKPVYNFKASDEEPYRKKKSPARGGVFRVSPRAGSL